MDEYDSKQSKPALDEIESQIESVQDQLDEIIGIQKNILYWIRIVGIFFLFSAIGSLVLLIQNILLRYN
jgi:hypothetical protein